MDNITDLSAIRWETETRAHKHKPVDALREMIRRIESGEVDAEHIVICVSVRDRGTQYVQAGEIIDTRNAVGLIEYVKHMMLRG